MRANNTYDPRKNITCLFWILHVVNNGSLVQYQKYVMIYLEKIFWPPVVMYKSQNKSQLDTIKNTDSSSIITQLKNFKNYIKKHML